MTEALLSVRDLKVHFPIGKGLLTGAKGAVKAVDGISFDLKPGETLGIVGEFGCGKSTLGRAILRLTKPTDGTVVWLGQDFFALDKASLRKARRELQIIFQDPLASLDPRMTVGAIIARPLKTFHPELTRDADRRAREGSDGAGRPGAGDDAALSARILRRAVPAHRHRARHDPAPQADRVRRAGVGARRLDPGADHQPAAQAAARSWGCRCCSSRTTCRWCGTSATA